MTYRLIDELGYEIDRGSRKRVKKSCSQNYGSRIVQAIPLLPVEGQGWQEKIDKSFVLLVNQPDRSTVVFHPELHTIK